MGPPGSPIDAISSRLLINRESFDVEPGNTSGEAETLTVRGYVGGTGELLVHLALGSHSGSLTLCWWLRWPVA